jgi:hypothetical protein
MLAEPLAATTASPCLTEVSLFAGKTQNATVEQQQQPVGISYIRKRGKVDIDSARLLGIAQERYLRPS